MLGKEVNNYALEPEKPGLRWQTQRKCVFSRSWLCSWILFLRYASHSWKCCKGDFICSTWESLSSCWPGDTSLFEKEFWFLTHLNGTHPAIPPCSCVSGLFYLLWKQLSRGLTQNSEILILTNLPTYKNWRSWKPGTLAHLLVVKTITWLGSHKQSN
jgi:hypothetical protein